MGRTYRKGGREADHKRKREQWKRQKGTKRTKGNDDEADSTKLPRDRKGLQENSDLFGFGY